MRLPEGSSYNRTDAACARSRRCWPASTASKASSPSPATASSTGSPSRTAASPSSRMKPFAERTDPARSRLRRNRHGERPRARRFARRRSSPSTCRRSSASAPARASSTSCSISRAARRPTLPQVAGGLLVAANQDPRLGPTFTTFSANVAAALSRPRPRAAADARRVGQRRLRHAAGHARAALRQRLQPVRPHLAGQRAGAPRPTAASVADIYRLHVRNAAGRDDAARAVARVEYVVGPQSIVRYNNYRSVTLNGAPAEGVSSGEALAAMEEISAATLPPGYGFEWTGHGAAGNAGRRADHDDPRAGAALCLPLPRRRSTRAGRSRSRSCSRSRSASPARSRR